MSAAPSNPPTPADLPPIVRAMLRPEFYPHEAVGPIELRQTHISYVLLTGPFAYKLKKPVDLGFLDFTTPRQRRHFCLEELRLNARGAPGLYLDVLGVTQSNGRYALAAPQGPGDSPEAQMVEYVLRMRQFPRGALFSECRLDDAAVTELARTVAAYHAAAPTGPAVAAFGDPDCIRSVVEQNYAQGERFVGMFQDRRQLDQTRAFTDRFFTENRPTLIARARGGFVRECHGDLHLGNICRFEGRILLFDCIEFNDAFRCVDVMHDVAFTAMDLHSRGERALAASFLNAYAEQTGDWEGLAVLPLYLCRHAYVRGKINSILATEPEADEGGRRTAGDDAARYYRLAWQYGRPRRGRLILTSGLSGSGKSTVARELARRLAAYHVRSDAVRKHLAGVPLHERGGDWVYTAEMTDRTYQRLLDVGLMLAGQGETVILDAKYDRRQHRRAAIEAAETHGIPLRIISCVAPPEVLRRRLSARRGDITDATEDLLGRQLAEAEPFTEDERRFVREVDSTLPPGEVVERLLGPNGAGV